MPDILARIPAFGLDSCKMCPSSQGLGFMTAKPLIQGTGMDEHGYPEEEELEYIKNFRDHTRHNELMDYIKGIWWQSDWGIRREVCEPDWRYSSPYYRYHISTGGWSGNESIISAMESNYLFWGFCWESSRRGGHYTFTVRFNEEEMHAQRADVRDTAGQD